MRRSRTSLTRTSAIRLSPSKSFSFVRSRKCADVTRYREFALSLETHLEQFPPERLRTGALARYLPSWQVAAAQRVEDADAYDEEGLPDEEDDDDDEE